MNKPEPAGVAAHPLREAADLRDRITYLMGQNQTMVTQTQFADAKAGVMLAFVGLIATRGPGAVFGSDQITVAVEALLFLHASVMVCCFMVLYPRYANRRVRRMAAEREKFSWPALASDTLKEPDFVRFMAEADLDELVASLTRSNHNLAQILLRKFTWLRAAFVIAVIDICFIAGRFVVLGM